MKSIVIKTYHFRLSAMVQQNTFSILGNRDCNHMNVLCNDEQRSDSSDSAYDSVVYDQVKTGSSESQAEAEELNQSQSVGMCIVISLSFRFCFRLRQYGFH